MDSFDLSEQRIVQLEQIPVDIRHQIERGDGVEYALDLSLNRLRSIDQIGVFEHVSQLDLSGNQLENVNGIQALRRLQSVDLSRNCIATVDLLALLPALQVLKVAENSLTTIDSLQLLPELRVVDASYNRITKWPPLAGLTMLETLDVSDNMLGAFSPSLSATLFPSRLRRLSLARNQIDKLCSIACLGLQLPMLEFLPFDGNPIVLEVARSGGQLERLIATFFPSLPLSNDGGLTMSGRRHDEFTTPPHTLNILKRAVLEGNEDILGEFLISEFTAAPGIPGGVFPPPAPVERPLPAQRQLSLNDTSDCQNTADNSLSHDTKMEIWKRIQEDRKTQFAQSSGPTLTGSTFKKDRSVKWGQDVEQDTLLQDDVRTPALTTADLAVPDQQVMAALGMSSVSAMNPLDASTLSAPNDSVQSSQTQNGAADNEVLVKKVKALTEQVVTMRKYMKIWIKREKMVRDASARKIQRWLRRLRRRLQLRQRVLRSRKRRQEEYCFHHCSSASMQNTNYRGVTQGRMEAFRAQTLQSHARGFITRRRIILFKKKHLAAYRIQRAWKNVVSDRQAILQNDWNLRTRGNQQPSLRWHGLLRGMMRCSRDVKQLQQVCAVQDDAISCLWGTRICTNSIDKANVETKIVRIQRLWRGHSMWKNSSNSNKTSGNVQETKVSPDIHSVSDITSMKSQIDQQSLEIDTLKQQLEALQNLVASLAVTKVENAK